MTPCIVFVANTEKSNVISVRNEAIRAAQDKGFECIVYDSNSSLSSLSEKDILFVAAFGGDGTILKSVRLAVAIGVPILGINLGRVGFLSEIKPSEFSSFLQKIRDSEYRIEERMMLSCQIKENSFSCLNEVLLYKGSFPGIARISIVINGCNAGTIPCDGIVISTPTGATGYAISAGGPIIAPGLDVVILAPICPHSLATRPIVAPASSSVELKIHSKGRLYTDGQQVLEIMPNECIRVTMADTKAKFLRTETKNLYNLIKQKLF